MSEPIVLRMSAGAAAKGWAEQLAEDWRLAGLTIRFDLDPPANPWQVEIVAAESRRIHETLFLDVRKTDIASSYRFVREAAQRLRAGDAVDFEDLVERTSRFWEIRSSPRSKLRLLNSWQILEDWLEERNRPALIAFIWNFAEIFPRSECWSSSIFDGPLFPVESEAPSWLRRIEVQRLILQVRHELFDNLNAGVAIEDLGRAAALCRTLGDRGLRFRATALRASVPIEDYEGHDKRSFARLEQLGRKAAEVGEIAAAIEIGELIAWLQAEWLDPREALATLETTAALLTRSPSCHPRIGHRLTLYRALAAPSAEKVAPFIEEIIGLMEKGYLSWRDSLDRLDRLKKAVGESEAVLLMIPALGEKNASGLAAVSRQSCDEDHERHWSIEARAERARRDREIRWNHMMYPGLG